MRAITTIALVTFGAPALAQTAADAHYDPARMAAARAALKARHGSETISLLMAERLEYRTNDGDPLTVWDAEVWSGNDLNKLWLKTEGEYDTEESHLEEAELQVLYSRAVTPFWELQTGLRHDFEPDPSRTYAVLGAHGMTRYWFELDGALFLSDEGKLSARLEAEYDFRLTQRLMLQPRFEVKAAFSEDRNIGVGSGLSSAEAGLRLRYEVKREIAPYIGVSWNGALGSTRDLRRAANEKTREVSWVAGIRFWY